MTQRRITTSRLSLLLVVLLCLSGCAAAPADSPTPSPIPTGSEPAPTRSLAPEDMTNDTIEVPTVPRVPADLSTNQVPSSVAPTRVRVPTLDIDMPVSAAGLAPTGDMELPENPAQAAWYRFGAAPASSTGTTVIAAHVDALDYGLGPFARLAEAMPGTEIIVTTAEGAETRYRVESVTATAKTEIPWDAVFDREGEPRLTLVTCGGEFNYSTRTYSSNVITTAVRLA